MTTKNKPRLTTIRGEATTVVSSKRALQIMERQSRDVKRVRFIAPKLGSGSFGHFQVTWKQQPRQASKS